MQKHSASDSFGLHSSVSRCAADAGMHVGGPSTRPDISITPGNFEKPRCFVRFAKPWRPPDRHPFAPVATPTAAVRLRPVNRAPAGCGTRVQGGAEQRCTFQAVGFNPAPPSTRPFRVCSARKAAARRRPSAPSAPAQRPRRRRSFKVPSAAVRPRVPSRQKALRARRSRPTSGATCRGAACSTSRSRARHAAGHRRPGRLRA